jgi:hypothetical protein
VVMRKFKKTPHTYYTGKDKIELAGALARYHGDKVTTHPYHKSHLKAYVGSCHCQRLGRTSETNIY